MHIRCSVCHLHSHLLLTPRRKDHAAFTIHVLGGGWRPWFHVHFPRLGHHAWLRAEDGAASCAHLNHRGVSSARGGALDWEWKEALMRTAERRREGGCSRTKCIEERGKAFLHLLSSQRQNGLLICLLCWSIFFSCTMTCLMQICFYIRLLKLVGTTTSCLCLLCDARRVIFANAYWS
jgi:hypothetical protein